MCFIDAFLARQQLFVAKQKDSETFNAQMVKLAKWFL